MELVPLLTAMLAYAPADRPALPEVVQQCRVIIEAQGLKVAQARRRLTTFTAPGPAARAAAEAPTEPVRQEPPAPALPLETSAPAVYTPTVKVDDPAPADKGQPLAPTPLKPKRPAAPAPLRHSVQARKVAQQLRETYAQSAAF